MRLFISKFGLMVALAMLLALVAGPLSADMSWDCPWGDDYNGDLELTGDCTLSGHVDGNIKMTGGTLNIFGTVDGNIDLMDGASLNVGLITDAEVQESGSVNGNIKLVGEMDKFEAYSDFVHVWDGSFIKDNIEVKDGDLMVDGTSPNGVTTVNGNIKHEGEGVCSVGVEPGVMHNGNLEGDC